MACGTFSCCEWLVTTLSFEVVEGVAEELFELYTFRLLLDLVLFKVFRNFFVSKRELERLFDAGRDQDQVGVRGVWEPRFPPAYGW
jgi:hypothetical protein